MSNIREDRDRKDAPLPDPVGEDGIVRKEDEKRYPEDEIDDKDAGLTDIGGGDPNERKII